MAKVKKTPDYVIAELEKDLTLTYEYPQGENIVSTASELSLGDEEREIPREAKYTWNTQTTSFQVLVTGVPGVWKIDDPKKYLHEVTYYAHNGRKIYILFKEK